MTGTGDMSGCRTSSQAKPPRFLRRRALRQGQEGIIVVLVAVFMLFVVGAMAAISIDITTLYTARSEAQLAADGAALAGARVLANSGATSDPNAVTDNLLSAAQTRAQAIAIQIAQQNPIGGTTPQVTVTFPNTCSPTSPQNNPCITVQVRRTDLPTFFARIWGATQMPVVGTATAEAYNPAGLANGTNASLSSPIATTCVKPWVLPNLDPSNPPNPIFDVATGAIQPTATGLLGWDSMPSGTTFHAGDPAAAPTVWTYYPGDPASFAAPTQGLPGCASAFTDFQKSIAGCVPVPISCSDNVTLLSSAYVNPDADAADAVNCLTHTIPNVSGGDTVSANPSLVAGTPFQFQGGTNNPIPGARGNEILVSDSLVTVPVYNSIGVAPGAGGSVKLIGFLQLFVNSDGVGTPDTPITAAQMKTTVINMVGCGTGANGTPIAGNGPSAVAVRLVTAP
jgi:Flp pilus assembly protein TadG